MLRDDLSVLPRHRPRSNRGQGGGETVDEGGARVDEDGGAVLGSAGQQGEFGEELDAFDPGGGPDRTGGGRINRGLPVQVPRRPR